MPLRRRTRPALSIATWKPANACIRFRALPRQRSRLRSRETGRACRAGGSGRCADRYSRGTGHRAGRHRGHCRLYVAGSRQRANPSTLVPDVFSFGCLLYEMVTGQRAFQRDSAIATLSAILHEEPKPISQLNGLPPSRGGARDRALPSKGSRTPLAVDGRRQGRPAGPEGGARLGQPRRHAPDGRASPAVHGLLWRGSPSSSPPAQSPLFWWRGRTIAPELPAASFSAVPLTTYPGREQQATFSPDGSSVAFSWNGEREENWDIYVKLVGPAKLLQQLTTDPGLDTSPAWSPDGRSIAFVRIHSLIGQPLSSCRPEAGPSVIVLWIRRAGVSVIGQLLSWSPDSRFLAVAAAPSDEKSNAITAVDVTSGKTSRLTNPPAGAALDQLPSLSPDGGTLAFVRRSGGQTGELWLQPLSGTFVPIGEPTRIGSAALFYHGMAWSRDGHYLIVSSGSTGNVGLWRVPVQRPGAMQRLSPTSDEWRHPAVSMQQGPDGVHADDLGREPLAPDARGCGAPSRSRPSAWWARHAWK